MDQKFILLDEFNDENINLSEIYSELIDKDSNIDKNDSNLDDSNDDEFYDIVTEGSIIPDIKIQVENDENNEKIVKFSLNIIINEETDESIKIDLNITKKTYLMIAEELFK
jgi:hypothetical protein